VPAAAGQAEARPVLEVRRGARYWLHGYRLMLRWELTRLRMWLPLVTVVQILAGAGFVLGIGLFFRHIPDSAALFVSTGVPVINIILVGLVLGPQLVADQKITQGYEFLRALPVPWSVTALAWYTVTLLSAVPAMTISLWIAHLRYAISFEISPAVVPATLLTAFTGTMMGYALGHAVANPMTTRLVTQVLVFVVFGFAPILFPVQQLPGWLAALNWWLPFRHMAVIIRGSLTTGFVSGAGTSYLIVSVWGLACTSLSAWALGRRE
jgi:ABC-2 type transport system permease protein